MARGSKAGYGGSGVALGRKGGGKGSPERTARAAELWAIRANVRAAANVPF